MGEGALRLKLAYNFCVYGTGNSRSFLPVRFACGQQKSSRFCMRNPTKNRQFYRKNQTKNRNNFIYYIYIFIYE